MFPPFSERTKVLLKRLYFAVFRGSPAPDRVLYAIDEPRGQRPLRIIRGRCVLRGWSVLRDMADPPRVRIRVNRSIYPVRIMPRADVRETLHRSPPFAEACGFELALQLSRGAHLVRVEVELRPDVWRSLSTSIFLSLGLNGPLAKRIEYSAWAALDEAWRPFEREVFEVHLDTMTFRPHFEIFVLPGGDRQVTQMSFAQQIYRDFTPTELADGEPAPAAGDPAGYRLFLRSGDRLTEDALYAFADRINADPNVDLLYGDEDMIDAAGQRQAPFFKPDWSPTYLAGANYLGRAAAYSNRLSYRGQEDRAALITAIGADARRVACVPRVLLHRPADEAAGLLADAGRIWVGTKAKKPERLKKPLVLLVVRPTGRPSDLAAWASRSDYSALEVVRAEQLSGRGVGTWLQPTRFDRELAPDDILLFVDDDLVPCSPLWIEGLVEALNDPAVGAAGPTLIDRSSGLLHLGLSNNDGEPGPIRVADGEDAPITPRNVLGVSRVCLATRMESFLAVGGFIDGLGADLEGLDYCLKLGERSLFTVHTPSVLLALPRWRCSRPEAIIRHQQTWPRSCAHDPFYREDALSTRPASYAVAMKLAAL